MKKEAIPILKRDLTHPVPTPGCEDLLLKLILSRITSAPLNHPSAGPLPVPEIPRDAGEAGCRQKVLSDWLKAGRTYEEFCEAFGPENGYA